MKANRGHSLACASSRCTQRHRQRNLPVVQPVPTRVWSRILPDRIKPSELLAFFVLVVRKLGLHYGCVPCGKEALSDYCLYI